MRSEARGFPWRTAGLVLIVASFAATVVLGSDSKLWYHEVGSWPDSEFSQAMQASERGGVRAHYDPCTGERTWSVPGCLFESILCRKSPRARGWQRLTAGALFLSGLVGLLVWMRR